MPTHAQYIKDKAYYIAYRKQNKANALYDQRQYRKTINGLLVKTYWKMKYRVSGKQKHSAHLYKGLPLLSREDFYHWAKNNETFLFLFQQWKESGYKLKYFPSIDRIDSSKGYTLDNIRFLPQCENSRIGGTNGAKVRWAKYGK